MMMDSTVLINSGQNLPFEKVKWYKMNYNMPYPAHLAQLLAMQKDASHRPSLRDTSRTVSPRTLPFSPYNEPYGGLKRGRLPPRRTPPRAPMDVLEWAQMDEEAQGARPPYPPRPPYRPLRPYPGQTQMPVYPPPRQAPYPVFE